MIGIYQDSFVDYLKNKVGDNRVKVTSKNIIMPCPYCEFNAQDKDHYHMYVSIEVPIFHCFHANCEKSGTLKKLLKTLEGHDISDQFVDKDLLKESITKREIFDDHEVKQRKIYVPPLNDSEFMLKSMYLKYRLKFSRITPNMMKGVIYDVDKFIQMNQIPVDEKLENLKPYLQSNFVGFLTEHNSMVVFRNIDETHSMKFYKLKIQNNNFLDYYRLPGGDVNSNKIILAEGVFDIFTEYLFDSLNLKSGAKLYASALSSKYISLIQSIIFHEDIFKPEIIILSDQGVGKNYYKKMKKFNSHIIDKMTVYYNSNGKDFNDTPIIPIKVVI